MSITARFPGHCHLCGLPIKKGQQIEREPGQRFRHADCRPIELPPDAVHLARGEGYGGTLMRPGEVVRNYQGHHPPYLVVLQAGGDYYREDGMSFGVGDEEGYVYWADCRPATEEEAAELRAQDELDQRRDQARTRVNAVKRLFINSGERPAPAPRNDLLRPQGQRLLDTQTIHGTGDWFVDGPEWTWYVRNNGMDGDNWSENNVATAGAGAIGYRLPRDPELLQTLHQAEQILNPPPQPQPHEASDQEAIIEHQRSQALEYGTEHGAGDPPDRDTTQE